MNARNFFNFQKVYRKLTSDEVMELSGFSVGFFYHFRYGNPDLLEFPLRTIWYSGISGLICGFGASFLSDLIPRRIRIVIPFTCAASCFYYQLSPFRNELQKRQEQKLAYQKEQEQNEKQLNVLDKHTKLD